MSISKTLKVIDEMVKEMESLEPVPLYSHIRDEYDSNVAKFSRETNRHVNSVSHQMSRGAIWYKGEIYVKASPNKTTVVK